LNVTVKPERPDSGDSVTLIGELENYLTPLYPLECQYGLSSEQLIRQGVAFFVMRLDGIPAGCGGVKLYGDFAEIKRMYVTPNNRGRGVGRAILLALETESRRLGVNRIVLETGERQPEALALYARAGFERIPAFGEYIESPLSVCMAKKLAS